MGIKHAVVPVVWALLAGLPVGQVVAADTSPGITVEHAGSPASLLPAADIAKLPTVQVNVAFGTGHGPRQAMFEGPLLYAVLEQAHMIDAAKPREHVRLAVAITGRDGYTAVLGLGEISPAFEGKQVILAEQMDGKPLGEGNYRVVVPGDHMGGRSVRDVARIAVMPLQPAS